MGEVYVAALEEIQVKRTLSVIINPNRYRSKAAEAFIQEVLPEFSTYPQELSLDHFSSSPNVLKEVVNDVAKA